MLESTERYRGDGKGDAGGLRGRTLFSEDTPHSEESLD